MRAARRLCRSLTHTRTRARRSYNLLQNRICNKGVANFVSVLLPWIISLPFYTGKGLQLVVTWSSLFINGLINFVIPIMFYVMSRDKVANALRNRRYVDYLKKCVDAERANPKHADKDEPTPAEAQLLLLHASVQEKQRRRLAIQESKQAADDASAGYGVCCVRKPISPCATLYSILRVPFAAL